MTLALELSDIRHAYAGHAAVCGVDLSVAPGETLCLLGPSGCGKTTLLRIAAGLIRPDAGRVTVNGRLVEAPDRHVPPEARRIGLVFQESALFPHLRVGENIGFGLRHLSRAERRDRVAGLLALIGLPDSETAWPHELSGGQQQRVALARALAPKPDLLLMDEPFSGLDARLRAVLREDTLALLRAEGVSVAMVTHDPDEALSMADRIAVMRAGAIEQIGTPEDLYLSPQTAFVAGFIAYANRLSGRVSDGRVETPLGAFAAPGLPEGVAAEVLIRPEAVDCSGAGATGNGSNGQGLSGLIRDTHLAAGATVAHVDIAAGGTPLTLCARMAGAQCMAAGTEVRLRIDPDRVSVFPA